MVEVKLYSIGEIAQRSGVSASALRFYERHGLIHAQRNDGNQRRYRADTLRRIAFVKAAQVIGLSLGEITTALRSLPDRRTPTKRDWDVLARQWLRRVDQQLAELALLRDRLDGCVGCGCLSLTSCALYNRDDRAAGAGSGARYLLGDPVPDPSR